MPRQHMNKFKESLIYKEISAYKCEFTSKIHHLKSLRALEMTNKILVYKMI